MEESFGTDLSTVRIHTGSSTMQMNKELHAQAFTHGRDIYVNAGKYDTSNTAGKHLLAHELTHVIQQGGSIRTNVAPTPDVQKLGDISQVPAGMSCTIANSSPGGITQITFGVSSSDITRSQQVGQRHAAGIRAGQGEEVLSLEYSPALPGQLPDGAGKGQPVHGILSLALG